MSWDVITVIWRHSNESCLTVGHHLSNNPGALSVTSLQLTWSLDPLIYWRSAWSSNKLQRHGYLIGYQEGSSRNGCPVTHPILRTSFNLHNRTIRHWSKVTRLTYRLLDCLFNSLLLLSTNNISKQGIADPLRRESTGHQWIPLTKDQSVDVILKWCLVC